MNWSRWLSLSIAVIYILFFGSSFFLIEKVKEMSKQDLVEGALGLVFWLILSLGCIWYGDELGEGLLGASFGGPNISSHSPGWAVRLMGWILLLIPAGISLWKFFGAKD